MSRISLAIVGLVALASACSQPAVRQHRTRGVYAKVIGSIFVQLEQEPSSMWDGFFDEDLYIRRPDFVFHFGGSERGWGTPTERVKFELGKPMAFVIALPPGRASLEELELVEYRGPAGWLLGALSTIDGTTFPADLEFDVDPRRTMHTSSYRSWPTSPTQSSPVAESKFIRHGSRNPTTQISGRTFASPTNGLSDGTA